MFLKLLCGRRIVGHYDDRHQEWHIRRPFQLFVDEQTLRKVILLASDDELGRIVQDGATSSEIAELANQ
jgi:hypothetical protein